MKLTFLGSGSAFTTDGNYHSNILVERDGRRLLLDCGSDARLSLNEIGLGYRDVEAVFVSHLHADHAGGLEWLGFTSHFDSACERPDLYVSADMADALWKNTLSGGMGSLGGGRADLNTFFKLHRVPRGGFFLWNGCRFQLVQTVHVNNGHALSPCYGLFFRAGRRTVFLSGDTSFMPEQRMGLCEQADVVFHDCETSAAASGVHPRYAELCGLPEAVRAKTWLYHVNPGPLPDARADGFAGIVGKGQSFDFPES
ncbi:beta-lactamase domain protein [Desulfovibrio sp. X2]|uniref:MBL fold metallo-hydrolase n=1 Tax=Desulfovibrio sp. X2 TaxID=941449 RepID=UPI000358ABE3|nr:MBL fold metallo-hydrolase [Desulfovibrio sp. X2]EPR42208.1 beta-lactamase domain protein [Desulfovibrio sp. X2]